MSQELAGDNLIGYCEIHCKTERALFKGIHINEMLELAGFPTNFPKSVDPDQWISVHGEMEELCKLARLNLRRSTFKLVVDNTKCQSELVMN